jgi:aquaporin Z
MREQYPSRAWCKHHESCQWRQGNAKHEGKDTFPVAGAGVFFVIASGAPDWTAGGFASNGYGVLSPGGYGVMSVVLIQVMLTAAFLVIILGVTSRSAIAGFAPIAIGLGLALIHLISVPVSNTSVNPARSTAAAMFAETGAHSQLWVFRAAPLVGAALGAVIHRLLNPTMTRRVPA